MRDRQVAEEAQSCYYSTTGTLTQVPHLVLKVMEICERKTDYPFI